MIFVFNDHVIKQRYVVHLELKCDQRIVDVVRNLYGKNPHSPQKTGTFSLRGLTNKEQGFVVGEKRYLCGCVRVTKTAVTAFVLSRAGWLFFH